MTLYFSRLVLGIQLVLAGVQLPSRYLRKEWRSLAILLGPIMAAMWLSTSLIIFAMVPNLSFLHALVIASCVTPTDPILSNVIVKGKFADLNVPKDLQELIVAESGANDGLGYPFLFLALYIIKYTGNGAGSAPGGVKMAMGMWFGENLGYTIILSLVYGAAVGWVAKELLHCESSTLPSPLVVVHNRCCGISLTRTDQGPRSTILSTARVFSSLFSRSLFSSPEHVV